MRKGCPLIQACNSKRIRAHFRPHRSASHRSPPRSACIVINPVVPIAERKHVVELDHHGERIKLPRGSRHPIGLLVIRPITEIADPELGEELRGMREFAVFWTLSAFGTRARCYLDRVNRLSDVTPLLIFTHPAGYHSANAEPMGDDLATVI